MIYAFRFVDNDNNLTGYYGVAFAKSLGELFWQIDEHGDPWSCELAKIKGGSFCFKTNLDQTTDLDNDDFTVDEIELSGSLLDVLYACKFAPAKWPKDIYGR